MIIIIDGIKGSGVSTQSMLLSHTLNIKKGLATYKEANCHKDMLNIISGLDITCDYVIDSRVGIEIIQHYNDQRRPIDNNFLNIFVDFALKNKVLNILLIPEDPREYSISKNRLEQDVIEERNSLELLQSAIPGGLIKYVKVYIKSTDKILDIQNKILEIIKVDKGIDLR